MPILKIGRRSLATLPNIKTTTLFYDSELKGFGIRLMPSGIATYFAQYRVAPGGRNAPTRRISFGRVGLLSPEKAREKARELLARARLGEDPAAARAEARKAATVVELLPRYQNETGARRRESTRKLYDMYWRIHILPAIGSKRARDVTYSEIASLHRAIGTKAPPTANRVLVILACFFDWVRRVGERPAGDNPARDIEKFEEEGRERFLSIEELGRLGAAIHEAETVGLPWEPDPRKKMKHVPKHNRRTKIDRLSATALRLILFSGARHCEILHAKREYLDRERGLLNLPTSKTGKKTIVLNALALSVIDSLPDCGPYLFPGSANGLAVKSRKDSEPRPRTSLKRAWTSIRKRAGLEDVRIHDLRHTFASIGVGENLGLPIVGKLLGHSNVVSTARYAHLAADPVRRASNAIGDTIAAALNAGRIAA